MEYQKIYDIKKAEKLLNKHKILDQNQKNKNDEEITKEKNKKKEKDK